jgi:flagellin-specific chaperone FliS
MLLEKARQLTAGSKRKIEMQQRAARYEILRDRSKKVLEQLERARKILRELRLFRERSLLFEDDFRPNVKSALEIVDRAIATLPDDPAWILDNQNFNALQFDKALKQVEGAIRTKLLRAWQIYLRQNMPALNEKTLQLLHDLPAFKPIVQRIRQLEKQIDRDNYPTDTRAFERTEEIIRELKRVWDEIDSDGIPDAVRIFIQAAASDTGAPFDLYTPEAREWVERHDVAKSLRIRLN